MARDYSAPFKTCTGCHRPISRLEWWALKFVGLQDDHDGGWLELRNCDRCHSTIAIQVEDRTIAAVKAWRDDAINASRGAA